MKASNPTIMRILNTTDTPFEKAKALTSVFRHQFCLTSDDNLDMQFALALADLLKDSKDSSTLKGDKRIVNIIKNVSNARLAKKALTQLIK